LLFSPPIKNVKNPVNLKELEISFLLTKLFGPMQNFPSFPCLLCTMGMLGRDKKHIFLSHSSLQIATCSLYCTQVLGAGTANYHKASCQYDGKNDLTVQVVI
jgi:hypothetical protein